MRSSAAAAAQPTAVSAPASDPIQLAPAFDTRHRDVLDAMSIGFCIIEILFDATGHPIDYRYLETNGVFEQQTGLNDAVGRTIRELVPDIRAGWIERYAAVLETRERLKVVDLVPSIGRWFEVEVLPLDPVAAPHQLALLFRDVSADRRLEAAREEAWTALQASRAQLRFALDSVSAGLFDWDVPTDVLSWDACARAIYGVPADAEPNAELLLSRMHPDDREPFDAALQQALAAGGTHEWRHRFRILAGDGVRWVDSIGRLVFGEQDGRAVPLRLSGLVFDVTADVEAARSLEVSQSALREAEERLLLAMSSSSLGWWDVNPDTFEVYWSPSARRLFDIGGDDETVHLSDPVSRMHADDRQRVGDAIARALRGEDEGRYHEQYRVIHRDGSVRWVDAIGQAHFDVVDGERRAVRFAGVLWDVTEQRRHLDAMREASRQKDVFLATLAHELRNPLAPVRTAAHLLAQAAHDPARVAWASEVIQRQVGHMGRLLEDLMDVARITRGRLTLQPQDVSLGDIVRSALESVQDAIDARGHVLEVDMPAPDAPVRLDPVRMSQVLSNLLANAAKYTDRGGRITLSARIEGSDAVLRVADTGIGLEPDRIDSIFDMFSQREEALSRAEGGLGIGLALVRGLVELHGGRVQASSEGPGKGSAFTVRVPAGHVQREAGTTAGDGAATKPLSILVADDNHDAADMLAALLGLGGHDVTIVYSGEDAIAQARRAPPDVALLDIGMPDISGYDVVIALREFLPAPGPHIAALSGWGRPEDQGRALAAGFDRHFTKPVDAGALLEWLATVATACRRSD